MLSPLPPADTGIAFCASTYFQSDRWWMDLYGQEAIRELEQLKGRWQGGQAHVLPLDAFGHVVPVAEYDALILQMGNSDHHMATLRAWQETLGKGPGHRAVFLHEAQLIRLWNRWCGEHPLRLLRLYRHHYPDRRFRLSDLYLTHEPGTRVPRGIRVLLALAAPDCLIVNSRFCARLVQEDLEGWTGRVPPIHEAFLPIPDLAGVELKDGRQHGRRASADSVAPAQGSGLRIGHFGNLSSGKNIHLLREAVERLRKDAPATLVLAGFGARRFAKRHRLHRWPWIEVHDSPSDEGLLGLMASVDAAVQLRQSSQGESSGVISQLLGLDIPVVVTDMGAFSELGDAVAAVDPGADASTIAASVQAALTKRGQSTMRALKHQRGLEAFHRTLLDILKRRGTAP